MIPFEVLVGVLCFVSIAALGGSVLVLRERRERAVRERLQAEDGVPPIDSEEAPGLAVKMMQHAGQAALGSEPSRHLAEELAGAGYYSKAAPAIYIGAKLLLLAAGLLGTIFLLVPASMPVYSKVALAVSLSGVLFFLPNYVLILKRRGHAREVRRHLPDVIDLMEICVCSGMGVDMAWNLIADEIRPVSSVLSDEMVLTNLEIHLGALRVTAIRNMGRRTDAEEVASFATMLAQSDRFGTSLADSLRVFAASMRQERTMRAQEAAEKVAVKLLFPMVLFIFPALLVVMAGPAGIRLLAVLGGD